MLWSRQHDYYSQTLLTKLIRKAGVLASSDSALRWHLLARVTSPESNQASPLQQELNVDRG